MEENKEVLIENQDFVILGNKEYSFFKEKLLLDLVTKKKEILSFFHLSSFPQVKVILFQYRDNYYNYLDTTKENESSIPICCENISLQQFYLFLKRSIFHKYTEIVYASICKEKMSWLNVGLAEILSGERDKLEKSDTRFRAFYLDKIVRRDKKVPFETFFQSEDRFVFNKLEEYDRYDISYLLVHYLLETNTDIYPIIVNEEKIKTLENTILQDCIAYYNQKYPVKENFYDIKNDGELMDYMNKYILYGWIDKEKQEHVDTLKGFHEQYRTSSIEEIISTRLGTCIEQAKLIQYWFNLKGIENKMFCYRGANLGDIEDIRMHTFVLFHYQDSWYHFEHSVIRKRGIYQFTTLEEAIEKTREIFLKDFELKELIEIPTIPDGLTYQEFNQYVSSFPRFEVEKGRGI